MTFFSNFANDSQTSHRVGLENQFFTKKVLLKFYLLKSNFATLIISMEIRLAIAPTLIAHFFRMGNLHYRCGAIVLSMLKGNAKT